MAPVAIHDAKTNLSKYIALIENGEEERIVIARGKDGPPTVMLVAYREPDTTRRLGIAEGDFPVPDDIDAHNAEIAALFGMDD